MYVVGNQKQNNNKQQYQQQKTLKTVTLTFQCYLKKQQSEELILTAMIKFGFFICS